MLLRELIEPLINNITVGHELPFMHNNPKNRMGHGEMHSVYNTNDPHIVSKKSHTYWIEGSDIYDIELVKTKAFNSNPYFPRIYNLNTVTDNRNQVRVDVDMERLQEFDSLELDVVIGYINNIVDISKLNYSSNTDYKHTNGILLDALCTSINNNILGNKTFNFIKDSLLIEALEFIKKLYKKYHLIEDFHSKNIMARIGKTGIQMVLTDPLAGERKMDFS